MTSTDFSSNISKSPSFISDVVNDIEDEDDVDFDTFNETFSELVLSSSSMRTPLSRPPLICPFEKCPFDAPIFIHANQLLKHLKECHQLVIHRENNVISFLEEYLSASLSKLQKKCHFLHMEAVSKSSTFIDKYTPPLSENENEDKNENEKNSTYLNTLNTNANSETTTSTLSMINSHKNNDIIILGQDDDEEDNLLRKELQLLKLEKVLKDQERERKEESKLPANCIFCHILLPNRMNLFDHMYKIHRFNIGLPDNLVYINEFLQILSSKYSNNICLYCEKSFGNVIKLRKHMRNKKHYQIHPMNHYYDKYYVINYKENGKGWKEIEKEEIALEKGAKMDQKDVEDEIDENNDQNLYHHHHHHHQRSLFHGVGDDLDNMNGIDMSKMSVNSLADTVSLSSAFSSCRRSSITSSGSKNRFKMYDHNFDPNESQEEEKEDNLMEENENDHWSDWDEIEKEPTMCLFDECIYETPDDLLEKHLIPFHKFDLKKFAATEGFDFYDLIKLVNYIRKMTCLLQCCNCSSTTSFDSMSALENHYKETDHASKIPDQSLWRYQLEYLTPTYEDDPLLRVLDVCLPDLADDSVENDNDLTFKMSNSSSSSDLSVDNSIPLHYSSSHYSSCISPT